MDPLTVTGSCLCGSVRYEVTGEPARFYHCHCGRCRKATGSAHASNLAIKGETVHWRSGESLVRSWKVPEAERFTSCFCAQCGSPLPRVVPALGLVVIPAGSLDGEPPLTPNARIFWASRATWSCAGDELPTFAEYPPALGADDSPGGADGR